MKLEYLGKQKNHVLIRYIFRTQLCGTHICILVLCVQEVVIHCISNLLYKMGHYFLDTQYLSMYICANLSIPFHYKHIQRIIIPKNPQIFIQILLNSIKKKFSAFFIIQRVFFLFERESFANL